MYWCHLLPFTKVYQWELQEVTDRSTKPHNNYIFIQIRVIRGMAWAQDCSLMPLGQARDRFHLGTDATLQPWESSDKECVASPLSFIWTILDFCGHKMLNGKWHSLLKSATRQDLGKHKSLPSIALSHTTHCYGENLRICKNFGFRNAQNLYFNSLKETCELTKSSFSFIASSEVTTIFEQCWQDIAQSKGDLNNQKHNHQLKLSCAI